MAGHLPNYIQYFEEEEEIYDQIQQLIEDEDGVVVEDEEEEDEDEEDDDNDDDVDFVPVVALPRVSSAGPSTSSQEAVISRSLENVVEDNEYSQRRTAVAETSSSNKVEDAENLSGGGWNRSEVDGMFCPICMEAWTNGGDHQIWCENTCY